MRQALSYVCLLILLAIGCEASKASGPPSGDQKKPNGDEASEEKARTKSRDGTDDSSSEDDSITGPAEDIILSKKQGDGDLSTPLIDATYNISVVSSLFSGANLCRGKINLKINHDFSVSFPSSNLSCLGGMCEVNMTAIKSMLEKSGMGGSKGDFIGGAQSDERFLSVEKIGPFQFTPPRPVMLLSPFEFDPIEDAMKVNESYSGSVKDTSTGRSARGSFNLKVEYANSNRIRWSLSSQGWDGIAKPMAGIVQRFEMSMVLNPISIQEMSVASQIGDLLRARSLSGANVDPQELARICGGSGSGLISRFAGSSGGGGDSGGGFVEDLIGGVVVKVFFRLADQKILGQVQNRDE